MATTRTELIELHHDVKINAIISRPSKLPAQQETPTVVFLHFWGGSARTWSLVDPLVSAQFPTLSVDFRGWGHSQGPDDANAYSISLLADDIEAVISTLRLDAIVLVGLSMGGKVAQLIAGRGPLGAALKGIVLVSPAPPTSLMLPQDMRAQQLHAYDNPQSAAFVAVNVLTATFQQRDLPDFVVDDMLKGNKWAKEAWPAYAMAEDVSEAAEMIASPVLVLAAEKDVVEPLDRVQREVVGRTRSAKLKVLSKSGHLSPLDAPEAVARHLLDFIAKFVEYRD